MKSRTDGKLLLAARCSFSSMSCHWYNSNSLSGKLSFIFEVGDETRSLTHFLRTLGMLFCVSSGCGEGHCTVAGTSGLSSFLPLWLGNSLKSEDTIGQKGQKERYSALCSASESFIAHKIWRLFAVFALFTLLCLWSQLFLQPDRSQCPLPGFYFLNFATQLNNLHWKKYTDVNCNTSRKHSWKVKKGMRNMAS